MTYRRCFYVRYDDGEMTHPLSLTKVRQMRREFGGRVYAFSYAPLWARFWWGVE